MRTPFAMLALLALASCGPPAAETDAAGAPDASRQDTCSPVGGGRACVPVVACLGTAGEYFTGQALGDRSGPISGTTSTGATCSGRWRSQGQTGTAFVTCSGDETVELTYTYRDPATGTATGQTVSSTGRPVTVLSGQFIDRFAMARFGTNVPAQYCPQAEAAAITG